MIEELKARSENKEIKTWIDTTLSKYIEKNNITEENQGKMEHIIDYLESRPKPLRLRKMSAHDAIRLSERWTKTLEKKGAHIHEKPSDIKVIKSFKSTGFKLVQLVGENAFKREGFLMKHCVGSYADKKGVKIYSLRDPINVPHCTIELIESDNQIQQVKGKGNGPIHPDYIKMVLSSLKLLGFNVRSSEMSNLGYTSISSELESFIKSMDKKLPKSILIDNTKFYNKNQLSAL